MSINKSQNNKVQENLQWSEALITKDKETFAKLLVQITPWLKFIADTCAYDNKYAAEEAADKAINKIWEVFNQLDNQSARNIRYPKKFFSKVGRNAIVDHFRSSKEEDTPTNIIDLRWIDETIPTGEDRASPIDDDEEDQYESGSSGWYSFKINKKTQDKAYKEWLKHIRIKNSLLRNLLLRFRFGSYHDRRNRKRYLEMVRKLDDAYQKSKLLVETVPGEVAPRVLKEYLMGHKQSVIALRLGLKEPNVSRDINKWIKAWGWGSEDLLLVRLSWLLYTLADISDRVYAEVDRVIDEMMWEHETQYAPEWRDQWFFLRDREIPQALASKLGLESETVTCAIPRPTTFESRDKEWRRWRTGDKQEYDQKILLPAWGNLHSKMLYDKFAQALNKQPAIEAFFGKLEPEDMPDLLDLASEVARGRNESRKRRPFLGLTDPEHPEDEWD